VSTLDTEIKAIETCLGALEGLDPAAKLRVIGYTINYTFQTSRHPLAEALQREIANWPKPSPSESADE
jgi:hypothetical protein